MNNFIVAIIILAVVIVFSVINSIYICSVCDDITALIDQNKLDEAKKLWEEKKDYISYFVRDAEMDVVSSEAEAIGSDTPIEDGEAVGMRFREAIGEIKDTEEFSLTNIF